MRRFWLIVSLAIMAGTVIDAALADDMDGRCAHAEKASSIQCYRQTPHARISYLEVRLLEPTRLTPLTSEQETPVDFALRQWAKCVAQATNAMADQSEPARTVVDAVFRRCDKYETAFRRVQPYKQDVIDQFKSEAMVPGFLDLIMSAREREKLGR